MIVVVLAVVWARIRACLFGAALVVTVRFAVRVERSRMTTTRGFGAGGTTGIFGALGSARQLRRGGISPASASAASRSAARPAMAGSDGCDASANIVDPPTKPTVPTRMPAAMKRKSMHEPSGPRQRPR